MEAAFGWAVVVSVVLIAAGVWTLVAGQSTISNQLEATFQQLTAIRGDARRACDLLVGIDDKQSRLVALGEETPQERANREELSRYRFDFEK